MNRSAMLVLIPIAYLSGAAAGDVFLFTANMDGSQEVPATDSPATGLLSGLYDDVTNEFSFSWEITDNLLGDPNAGSHIHNAPVGMEGGVVFGFDDGGIWPLVGEAVWSGLSEDHVAELFAGNMYVNFHTSANTGGEIRGQILLVPAPGAAAGLAILPFLRRRR